MEDLSFLQKNGKQELEINRSGDCIVEWLSLSLVDGQTP